MADRTDAVCHGEISDVEINENGFAVCRFVCRRCHKNEDHMVGKGQDDLREHRKKAGRIGLTKRALCRREQVIRTLRQQGK